MTRKAISSLLRPTLTILAAFMGIILLQDQLLYFPEAARVEEMASGSLRPWPSAEEFRGLLAEPEAAAKTTAIVFHGTAGHAGHRAFYADMLTPFGVRVILAEYPGYGPREGDLGEVSLVRDAEGTLARAHAQFGSPLILIGESLGAAVVAAASPRHQGEIAGLVLITPWDRLENVAAHHYPFLPVSLFLHDRYDSAFHLSHFSRPVVVVVAQQDDIVPARFGLALFNALPGIGLRKMILNAGHNDWPGHVDSDWWRGILQFLGSESPEG